MGSTTQLEEAAKVAQPKSTKIIAAGIANSRDFAKAMSLLMADLAMGRVTPQQGNAICNAGGKMLKVVELQMKYGTKDGKTGEAVLQLG